MSVFGVFLVRIFPHLDWIRRDTKCGKIRTRKTPNTGTFHVVSLIRKDVQSIINILHAFNEYSGLSNQQTKFLKNSRKIQKFKNSKIHSFGESYIFDFLWPREEYFKDSEFLGCWILKFETKMGILNTCIRIIRHRSKGYK